MLDIPSGDERAHEHSDTQRPTEWEAYVEWAIPRWRELLKSDPLEDSVQQFLEENPAFVPGGDGEYRSGHHSPHGEVLFTQPKLRGLGAKKVPDFMWIGATSEVVTPVLVEIERPGKRWFTKTGLSSDFHQAHGQLGQWRDWFRKPVNQLWFRETYLDWIWDFSRRDIQPHYILVYGRRSEFDSDTSGAMMGMRVSVRGEKEELMSFDRIRPNRNLSDVVTVYARDNRELEIRNIQPCFKLGPPISDLAVMSDDPDEAIAKVPLWTQDRRDYVAKRWHYWKNYELERRSTGTTEFMPIQSTE